MSNATTDQITDNLARSAAKYSLKADALLAEFVIIPRSELPEVEGHDGYLRIDGKVFSSRDMPNEHWRAALNCLAIVEYSEAQKIADGKRSARRDELARELHTKAYGQMSTTPGFANSNNALQVAINRIIDMEDALA